MTTLSINPAFEFLKRHKEVSEETQELVMKKIKGKISQSELITAFENGISGQYGKVYKADAQTLIGWVEAFQKGKNAVNSYLESGLVNPDEKVTGRNYPGNVTEWMKEANKALVSFLNGVSENHFHPHIYDRLLLDGKIRLNQYSKYFVATDNVDEDVKRAKQKVLRDVFLTYKSNGWSHVYFI